MNNFDYDENLTANPFYAALQARHGILLQAAAQENWVICVPRAGYFERNTEFSTDFVLRHILAENELSCHYTNLLGKNVILDERQVILVAHRTEPQQRSTRKSASILFEEIVYRTDPNLGLSKFKLWCLDKPIVLAEGGGASDSEKEEAMAEPIQYYKIESFEQASKFLDSEFVKSKCILQKAQKICQEFLAVPRSFATVEMLHKTTKVLLNKIWNLLLSSNFYAKKLAKEDPNYAKMLKMAVENYATHFVSRYLLDRIAVLEPSLCELMNRKILNLNANLSEEEDGKKKHQQRLELTRMIADKLLAMEDRSTVYDKLSLLRDILKGISQVSGGEESPHMRSSDEMLEILVDAMIRGRSMNWHQNLVLLKRFQFADCNNESSELSYLVTTLEAAQQWILQEKLLNESPRMSVPVAEAQPVEIPTFQSKREFIAFLFRKIRGREEETVLEMVNLLTSADDLKQKLVSKDLCHPLCDCDDCQLKITAETPTIGTQEEGTGNTCVHLVAKYGLVNALRRILAEEQKDAKIDGEFEAYHRLKNLDGETPMHVAGKFGQQNILLLLLHHDQGVNLNVVDMQGNSVLHLASRMGHLSCVKALLYFAEHKQLRALQVNGKNYAGDTSLHLAAKTGFKGIVETLLEFTASKAAKNNVGKTAADVAFSSSIREIIKDDSWDRIAVNHKLKGLEQRLDAKQVEMVNRAIEREDVNLALSFLKISQQQKDSDEGVTKEDLDIIADLDAEDRVNSCTAEGVYPIHVAMKCNNLFMAKILVKYNVDFDVRTKERNESPFHWAALGEGSSRADIEKECLAIKYVFDNVPNLDSILNDQNWEGDTVLHLAVKCGNLRLIHLLLKFNINFALVNGAEKDAIGLARELGMTEVADYMEYLRFHAEDRNGKATTTTTDEELSEATTGGAATTPESSSTSSQSR